MKYISLDRRKVGFPLVVFLLLALMGFSMFRAASMESQTWDEAIHISAGYIYWKTGDFRHNTDHPILSKLINTLPLLLLDLKIPDTAEPGRIIQTGREFLYENTVPADRILFLTRSVTILLTLGFGLVLALYARRQFGDGPALLTLLLFTFDPNLLAHGHYVTSDMFVTVFVTLAVLAWGWYLERGGPWRLVAAGVLAGLALASKTSALALAPILLVVYLVHSGKARRGWKHGLGSLAGLAAAALLTLSLIYSLEVVAAVRHFLWNAKDLPFVRQSLADDIDTRTELGKTLYRVALATHLPSFSFLTGLLNIVNKVGTGHHNYLLGQLSDVGWWYYFPVAMLVKTPVATLQVSLLSLAALRRRAAWEYRLLLIPVVLFLGISMLSRVNIGLRHILPVYPFLLLLGPAVLFRELKGKLVRGFPILVGLVAFGIVAESAAIHPHYLAFFNVAAGGPKAGLRYLADSNLDWGQDLKHLKDWHQKMGDPPLCIQYFGTASLDYYRLPLMGLPMNGPAEDWERVNCYAAVSATVASGAYANNFGVARFRKMAMVDQIGHSIYIYDLRRRESQHPKRPIKAAPRGGGFAGRGTYDDHSPRIEYEGTWAHEARWSHASRGTVSFSYVVEDVIDFWFEGEEIEFVYTRAANRGIAGVTIDGGPEIELDQYSHQAQWQARWNPGRLAPGRHHMRVRVLPKRNHASGGYFVDLDSLIVR